MPPRPFLSSVNVGIDICHIPRIFRLITKDVRDDPKARPSHLFRFLSRTLTPIEQAEFFATFKARDKPGLYGSDSDPYPHIARHLAGRHAAKEAVKKTGVSSLGWSSIVVTRAWGKSPTAIILDHPYTKRNGLGGIEAAWIEAFERPSTRIDDLDNDETTIDYDEATIDYRGFNNPTSGPRITKTQMTPKSMNYVVERLNFLDGQMLPLSISHDGEYATAVCIRDSSPTIAPPKDSQSPVVYRTLELS
ncbi:hypothetical protein K402DRAFT_392807 [Aulographum hederae CBS 113979]|uniref:Uncharacterized protein n=1 Tax=Aulographum hederae CBS 113979 TaxID=1176131 RepID=A0A6G1H3G6_9PEZI|nr:hypothetical protein K402DRAFT_392807 [Aulographum hederae CBS 113979]